MFAKCTRTFSFICKWHELHVHNDNEIQLTFFLYSKSGVAATMYEWIWRSHVSTFSTFSFCGGGKEEYVLCVCMCMWMIWWEKYHNFEISSPNYIMQHTIVNVKKLVFKEGETKTISNSSTHFILQAKLYTQQIEE